MLALTLAAIDAACGPGFVATDHDPTPGEADKKEEEVSLPAYGNRADGNVTISASITDTSTESIPGSSKTFAATRKVTGVTSGNSVFNLGSSITGDDIAEGDVIIWVVSAAGTESACDGHQGKYGFSAVSATSSNAITLVSGLPFTPENTELTEAGSTSTFCMIQVVRVPNFEDLTISSGQEVSPPAFSFTTGQGGVLAVKVAGTLTLDGNINASGDGLPADPGSGSSGGTGGGYAREGFLQNSIGAGNNFNGGANGVYTTNGGAGGGSVGAGGDGGGAATGGASLDLCSGSSCVPDTRIFPGGAGGAAGSTATGGSGGGILLVFAADITGSGSVSAGGEPGATNAWSGGGGGAGGYVYVRTDTLGAGAVFSADGGSGGSAANQGGGGGGGAVLIHYCSSTGVVTTAALGGSGLNNGTDGLEGAPSLDSSACP